MRASKHLRIASVLEILLGLLSIVVVRWLLDAGDTAGLTAAEGKPALFGVFSLYVVNGFKILAGLLGLLLAGRRSLLTVICGFLLFIAQLYHFFQTSGDWIQIVINIVLLAIPYYYLHNAFRRYRSEA